VKGILTDKRETLIRIAKTLLEKETIEGDELRALMKEVDGQGGDEQPRQETD
jgi:ATP-dependent Zn protease